MNKQLSCVIIDDEPLAQSLLEKYIQKIHYLSLKAMYDNAIDAIEGFQVWAERPRER